MPLEFPPGFMWGTATAAHQVEGNNTNSDWWDWELRPDTPVAEPSGAAIDHFHRYADDIAMLAQLGFGVYRFSTEWARIEPEEGVFDPEALRHYRAMAAAVRRHGMEPMVTLHHFTIPRWFADKGGFMSPEAPVLFDRYCRAVVTAMEDMVDWFCTINEPGMLAMGGYLGAFGWPPGTTDMDSWHRAINELRLCHVAARVAIKEIRPEAKVGMSHAMSEYESNRAGRPLMEYLRKFNEDVFFEVCEPDDFVGIQAYTRVPIQPARWMAPLIRALAGSAPIRRMLLPRIIRRTTHDFANTAPGPDIRRTDMGYEWRPQTIAATVRRAGQLLPGKDLIVTEHGIAAADDSERIEFITEGLEALHAVIEDGIPLKGYLHWSAFDNFEWALGYGMQFGLVAVDRATQQRFPKPSARFLGEIARANALDISRI